MSTLSNTVTALKREGHSFRLSFHADRPIPSNLFDVFRGPHGDVTLTAELSDLEAAGHDPFRALFSDACDIGFTMRSSKTGEVVVYALASERRDRETDMLSWTFHPTAASVRRVPSAGDTCVTIFND